MKRSIIIVSLFFSYFLFMNTLLFGQQPEYIIQKTKDNLACMKIFFVKGNEVIYLKNSQDEPVYKITLDDYSGFCQWQKDIVLFNKNADLLAARKIEENLEKKLYLDLEFTIKFKIEKIKSDEFLDIQEIVIPYYVLFNDNKEDNIEKRYNNSITLKLPERGEVIYETNKIKLDVSFLSKDLVYKEILVGMYLQNK